MDTKLSLLAISMVFTASACCSPGVKPGEAGLFQAACGVASGDFDRQAKEKEEEVAKSREELDSEEQRTTELDTTATRTRLMYQKSLTELQQIERENETLQEKIRILKVSSDNDKQLQQQRSQKLGDLNNKIKKLRTSIENNQDQSHEQELQQLKQEVEALRLIILAQ